MGGCLLPAQDSLAELRAVISEHLKSFLTPDSSEEESAPRPLAPIENAISGLREWRNDPRRVGVSDTAAAVSLRDEVATEIAARLHSNPSQQASFDTTGEDDNTTTTRAGVTTSSEGMEQAGSGSTVSSLPLGARLKPRGIFEDDWTATLSTQRPWPGILLHGTCDNRRPAVPPGHPKMSCPLPPDRFRFHASAPGRLTQASHRAKTLFHAQPPFAHPDRHPAARLRMFQPLLPERQSDDISRRDRERRKALHHRTAWAPRAFPAWAGGLKTAACCPCLARAWLARARPAWCSCPACLPPRPQCAWTAGRRPAAARRIRPAGRM